mgnify:CR=1 FL=1
MNRVFNGDQFFQIVENSIENCTGFSNSVLVTGSGSFLHGSLHFGQFLHQFLCIIGFMKFYTDIFDKMRDGMRLNRNIM